jgi:hypothetical protein
MARSPKKKKKRSFPCITIREKTMEDNKIENLRTWVSPFALVTPAGFIRWPFPSIEFEVVREVSAWYCLSSSPLLVLNWWLVELAGESIGAACEVLLGEVVEGLWWTWLVTPEERSVWLQRFFRFRQSSHACVTWLRFWETPPSEATNLNFVPPELLFETDMVSGFAKQAI